MSLRPIKPCQFRKQLIDSSLNTPDQIITFWFDDIDPQAHWRKDLSFDALLRERFATLHRAALACELHHWRQSPLGRLAEIIVLDQFSRNMYRDTPNAFTADPLALALAQEACRVGADRALTPAHRVFLYMPYMHSESNSIHITAELLFTQLGIADNLRFEQRHRQVIQRFGRYPHRNAILGRVSTPEELEFLAQPGSSF